MRYLAALGALLSAAATYFVYHQFTALTLLAVGATLAFGTYAVLATTSKSGVDSISQLRSSRPRLARSLAIGFFLLMAISLYAIAETHYTKPLLYYAAIGLAAAILFVRVVSTTAIRSNALLAGVFVLNTFSSNQIAYPGGMRGPDYTYHVPRVAHILNTGTITDAGTYSTLPGQHLGPAIFATVVDLPAGSAYLAMGLGAMLIGAGLTFVFARMLANQQFAVLAVLFYGSISYVVFRAGHPTQLAHVLPLLLFLFVLVFYVLDRGLGRWSILFLMTGIALVITHHYSSFIAVVMLLLLFIGMLVWSLDTAIFPQKTGSRPIHRRTRMKRLTIVFGLFFTTHMAYTSGLFGSIVGTFVSVYRRLILSDTREGGLSESPRFLDVPPEQFFLNTIGEGLLVFLVVLGILAYLRSRTETWTMLTVWLLGAGFLAAVGVIIDTPFIIPQRVYVIAQITVMGFLAIRGLLHLVDRFESLDISAGALFVLLGGIVFLFVFFSTASTIAGLGTSPFNDGIPYPIYYDISEEQASEEFLTSNGISPEELTRAARFPIDENRRIDYTTVNSGMFVSISDHRLSTGVTVQGGSGIGATQYAFPSAPMEGLHPENNVYDNGDSELYQIR